MHNSALKMHRVASVIRNALTPQARSSITTRYVQPDADKENEDNQFSLLGANVEGLPLRRSGSWTDGEDKGEYKEDTKVNDASDTFMQDAFVGSCTLAAGQTLVELTRQKFAEQNNANGCSYTKNVDSLINHILPCAYAKPIFVNHMDDPSKAYKPQTRKPNTSEATSQTDLPVTLSLNSIKEAERITLEAVQSCESDLQNWKGLEFLRKGLHPEAFEQLRLSARSNPKAMYNLGQCYFKGHGTVTNMNKAINLWKRAASMGHAKANYQLAVCYLKGVASPVDKGIATSHMHKAADGHLPQAQFWIGSSFLKAGSMDKGISLIGKADNAGFKPAHKLAQKVKECIALTGNEKFSSSELKVSTSV